jgi:signal peptidase I
VSNKKRSIILSVLISLLVPPLGHVYVGRPLRGISIFGVGFITLLITGWLGASTALWSFYFAQSLYVIFIIILSIDAGVLARRQSNYTLRFYNKWFFFLPLILISLYILNFIMFNRGLFFGFDNHRNISENMSPTLKAGDFIATDKREYLNGIFPERKNIISFQYPKDPSTIYVKRVIGLPGEKIFIKNGVVHINNKPITEPYVPQSSKIKDYSQSMIEIDIPKDHIFVLGDNRDNSNDSRFWGFLPIENITGNATLIWYSENIERIKPLK